MADAMFTFTNNAAANAQQIADALNDTVRSIENAARRAGGTTVPVNFGDQIIGEANRAVRESQQIMQNLLDPRKLGAGQSFSIRQVNDVLSQNAAGAFQQAQREMDRIFSQLSPSAMAGLYDRGDLDEVMRNMSDAIAADIRGAYTEFRDGLSSQLKRQLPTLNRLGGASRIDKTLADQTYALDAAHTSRFYSIFGDPDAAGDDGPELNETAYLEREHRANQIRQREAIKETQEKIQEGRRQLALTLATLVGNEDPYAVALRLKINPATGQPARKVGEGYEDITDPRKIAEAVHEMDQLRAAHTRTLGLLGGAEGTFGKIPGSQYYALGDGDEFFEKATQGSIQYFRSLDNLDGKLINLREAQAAWNREAQRAQDAAAKGTAAAAAQAQKDLQREQGRIRGFLPGVAHGAFGRGFNGGGDLDTQTVLGNLGTTAGSAIRYSVAYGGFYQLTQAATQGLAIFEDYQDSFTDYQVAVGNSSHVTSEYTNELMELSRALGENVGAAFDAAARGVRAFASDMGDAEQKVAGTAIAEASQKIAVIANKKLTDATGDAIAIGTGFGLDAEQTALLVPDAIANAKRTLGGDPTQIAQGLANFAVTAQEAGYSLQEAANIISLVQAKTDQTGQAVATRLSRIISIVGGSTGKGLIRQINNSLGEGTIEKGGSPKEQLEQIAKAYLQAGNRGLTGLQGSIRNQLGGTSNLKELLPLLEDQKRLQKAFRDALPGAGEDEYSRKIENLIGDLNKIKASFKNLVVLAANSDIFAPFGAAVKTLSPALHLLESILKVFEKLEGFLGPAGAPIMIGAEAMLAVKGFTKLKQSTLVGNLADTNGVTGAVLQTMGAGGPGVSALEKHALRAQAFNAMIEQRKLNAIAALPAGSTLTDRLAVAASFSGRQMDPDKLPTTMLGGLINDFKESQLSAADRAQQTAQAAEQMQQASEEFAGGVRSFAKIALYVGLLIAANEAFQKSEDVDKWQSKIARREGKLGIGSEELRNTADTYKSLAASSKNDIPAWWDAIMAASGWQDDRTSGAISSRATADAQAVQAIAARVAAEEKLLASYRKVGVFGEAAARTADSIAEAFAEMDASGAAARQQTTRFFKALMTPDKPTLGSWEAPAEFSNTVTSTLVEQIRKTLQKETHNLTLGDRLRMGGNADTAMSAFRDWGAEDFMADFKIDTDKLYTDVLAGVKNAGKNLNDVKLNDIIKEALAGQDFGGAQVEGASPVPFDELRQKVFDAVKGKIDVIQHQLHELRPITAAELDALLQSQQAEMGELDPSDPTLPAKTSRKHLFQLLALKRAAQFTGNQPQKAVDAYEEQYGVKPDKDLGFLLSSGLDKLAGKEQRRYIKALNVAIRMSRHATREALVAEAEDARAVAEALAKGRDASDKELQAIRIAAAKLSFRRAGADVKLLEALMESMDVKTVKAMIAYRRTAVETARAALKHALGLIAIGQQILATGPDGDLLHGAPPSQEAQEGADKWKTILKNKRRDLKAILTAFDRAAIDAASVADDAGGSEEDKYKGVRGAKAQAWAARVGGSIASARASVIAARESMNDAEEGTTEWYQALASYYQAQQSLRDAMIQYRNNLDLLQGDHTDPVENARDAMRAAARKLASDRRAGQSKDVLAADRVAAQDARSSLLGAKFDQKFSDMQTAEDLGRISFAKYMHYLDSEHDRLSKIKHRTRQQQDQLDQVDKAMKEAASSMDQQFNLGDINTNGLVYQVRRFRAEQRANSAAAQISNMQNNTQNIHMQFDGTDLGEVKRVLKDMLGWHPGRRNTVLTRKV